VSLLEPGRNCWRVERADRFRCVLDGEEYYRSVRDAILAAERSVFILGWDITSGTDLVPGAEDPDAPTKLGALLDFAARRRRRLHIYVLIWDYAALYSLERDPFSRIRLGWGTHRRVRFRFDDQHPAGGSHHQKVVVVDDRLAFSGSIDLTAHRWDSSEHKVDEPRRVTPTGKTYEPYHEVVAMVDGRAAEALGELCRERWRRVGARRLPRVEPSARDLWPAELEPDLQDVDVAIVRNEPGFGGRPPVREAEALFVDSIAAARQTLFVENQYFTSPRLGEAFGARLREPDGPELTVVGPKECEGWLERKTMGAMRRKLLSELARDDRHGRLRLLYPLASRSKDVCTFIHSKVMVVDDELLRIGSANLSNRSMSIDTECDLAVCADGDERIRAGIRRVRDAMVGHFLGQTAEEVARAVEREGSLRAAIDALRRDGDRTLGDVEVESEEVPEPSAAIRAAADPEDPAPVTVAVERLLPELDVQHDRARWLLWILPAAALLLAVVIAEDYVDLRDVISLGALRHALELKPSWPITLAAALPAFVAGSLLFVPLELLVVISVVFFGPLRGGALVLAGTALSAALGYLAGRALGLPRLVPLVGRRVYRLSRLLLGRTVTEVAMLHLVALASRGSLHLLCGAAPVPPRPFALGTAAGIAPILLALGLLAALVRRMLLDPGPVLTIVTLGVTVLLALVALRVRLALLRRSFSASTRGHAEDASFG